MTDQPAPGSRDVAGEALATFFPNGTTSTVDQQQATAVEDIRRTMRAVLGSFLSKRPDDQRHGVSLLNHLLVEHGELTVNVGVGYLTEAAVGHWRHACAGGSVEIDFDMSNIPPDDESRPLVEQSVRLASELLTGVATQRDLRTASALRELSENPAVAQPTMTLLARYAAAQIEAVQNIAGEAVEAYFDSLPKVPETPATEE